MLFVSSIDFMLLHKCLVKYVFTSIEAKMSIYFCHLTAKRLYLTKRRLFVYRRECNNRKQLVSNHIHCQVQFISKSLGVYWSSAIISLGCIPLYGRPWSNVFTIYILQSAITVNLDLIT